MSDTQTLIQQTGTIKHNDVMTQIVPELMIKAADIIKSVEMIIDRNPAHQDRLIEMRDLKLKIAHQTYVCDQIQNRITRASRDATPRVLEWAKDKSFGPLLGKDGLIDMKKCKALIKTWGPVRMKTALTEYNDQLVPHANKVLGKAGVWSAAETKKAKALQDLQRQHNALAMSLRGIIQ
jgi:hypothetical protein